MRESNCLAHSIVDDLKKTMECLHWKPLIIAELRAFIAIHLYMGLKK